MLRATESWREIYQCGQCGGGGSSSNGVSTSEWTRTLRALKFEPEFVPSSPFRSNETNKNDDEQVK